jgi:hypothetical protein
LQSQEIYALGKKPFSILRHIIPTEEEDFGSTIAWQNFVKLMAQLGCTIETNGGPAFAFLLKGKGRIAIHRPHPDSTLQSYHLRDFAHV